MGIYKIIHVSHCYFIPVHSLVYALISLQHILFHAYLITWHGFHVFSIPFGVLLLFLTRVSSI
jgi:hypothetical protein